MAKICTNEKTASRQQWIENGLLERMQERRYEEITVTDLCLQLGLSRRSFYRYFRDIDDVLDSVLNHAFQSMTLLNTPFSIAELTDSYAFWLRHKMLLSALVRSEMHGKITEYALKYADVEKLKTYLSPEDADMEISREINLFAVSGMASLLVSWYADGFQKTPEQMARIAHRLLSSPILPVK